MCDQTQSPTPRHRSDASHADEYSCFTRTRTSPFPASLRYFQAFSTPKSIHAFAIHKPSYSSQRPGDHPITVPKLAASQLHHPTHQRLLFVTLATLISLTAARLIDHGTGPPLGHAERAFQLFDCCTLPGRAHQFPSEMCFSILLSRVKSATISFSRLFSSCSCFRRFASSHFITPDWFRHQWNVASLTSNVCSTTASSLPAFKIASASRSFRTICCGV